MSDLENFSDEDLIQVVNDYAEENFQFDNSYAEAMEKWLEENDDLTQNQRQGLVNIIEKFHMSY